MICCQIKNKIKFLLINFSDDNISPINESNSVSNVKHISINPLYQYITGIPHLLLTNTLIL